MPKEFFIWRNENPHGPHTLAKLQEMLQTRQVKPDTLVCEKGGKDWVPLGPFLESVQKSQGKGIMALGALLVVLGVFYAGGILIKVIDEEMNGHSKLMREQLKSLEDQLSDNDSPLYKKTEELQQLNRRIMPEQGFSSADIVVLNAQIAVAATTAHKKEIAAYRQVLSKQLVGRILHGGIAGALIIGGVLTRVVVRKKHSVASVATPPPPPPNAQRQPSNQSASPPPKAPSRPAAPQMMLKDLCPACNQSVEYPAEISGQAVKCPSCQADMTLA